MITDAMLAEAAAEIHDALLAGLPPESECKHQFSPKFYRRMKRVIRKGCHPLRYRILQRAACFALVLLLSFASVMAASPQARAAVLRWIREQYENYTKYTSTHNQSQSDSAEYTLNLLPEGYQEVSRNHLQGYSTVYYVEESTGRILYFAYSQNADCIAILFAFPEDAIEKVTVRGVPADFYDAKDPNIASAICWFDPTENTFFVISAFAGKEEIISLSENLKKCEN